MKANLQTLTNTLLNAINKHLEAGKTLRQALDAIKPEYNKASVAEQVEIQQQVAELIGKEYGIKPIITNRGTVGFDRKTKAGNQARSMYLYYFPTKTMQPKKASTKTSNSIDPVEDLIAKYYALSKKDQSRFDKLLANDKRM